MTRDVAKYLIFVFIVHPVSFTVDCEGGGSSFNYVLPRDCLNMLTYCTFQGWSVRGGWVCVQCRGRTQNNDYREMEYIYELPTM